MFISYSDVFQSSNT